MSDEPFHEWTSCEEYGHDYRHCGCEPGCIVMFCRDCDDEYEED